jgi:hypothetical protein
MVATLVEVVGVGSAPLEQRSHERPAEQLFRNELGRRHRGEELATLDDTDPLPL